MTLKELETRVEELAKELKELRNQIQNGDKEKTPWWIRRGRTFANDPVYDEIVRLGREYRESLRPAGKGKKKNGNAKKQK